MAGGLAVVSITVDAMEVWDDGIIMHVRERGIAPFVCWFRAADNGPTAPRLNPRYRGPDVIAILFGACLGVV